MKLLLTSAGLRNKSIANALKELAGKNFDKLNLVVIPTAMNIEEGDKDWYIDDLANSKKLGFKSIDIVDISAVERNIWEPRLKEADVLMFGGGNTFYLMDWVRKSGLKDILPEMLKEKVYVGISAGSMITSHSLDLSDSENLYDEAETEEEKNNKALGYVNIHIRPHFNSPYFPKLRSENIKELAKGVKEPVYAIDDQTAIQVVDGEISVVSEGEWVKF